MVGWVLKIKVNFKIGPQLLFNDSSSLEIIIIIIIINFWPNVVFLHTLYNFFAYNLWWNFAFQNTFDI
jgi:hypothetical protein